MAVTITKPAVNIREKLSQLERPIGINGASLMATNTPQEAFSLIGAGRKNIIINGAFDIWQRGTSGAAGSGASRIYHSADRWFKFNIADATDRIDVSSENIGGVTGRFKYAIQISGTQSTRILGQCIEGPLPAGNYIFSAWVKFSQIPTSFYMNYNSTALTSENNFAGWYGGSGTSISYTEPNNISQVSQTGVWYRLYKKFTAVSPHLGLGIAFQPLFPTSTTATVQITGVQVERVENGSTPTEFEYRSYQQELALCQRYYQQIGKTSSTNDGFASGFVDGTNFYGVGFLKQTMRTAPAVSYIGNIGDLSYTHPSASFTVNSIASYQSNPDSYVIRLTSATSGTTGYGAYARSVTSSTAITFSAEL